MTSRRRAASATATSASATNGMAGRTGDATTSSTATVSTICTTWPATRSHTTARSPWLIPRWTSPTIPPGSVTLRKIER